LLQLADDGPDPAGALAHLARIHELQHDWRRPRRHTSGCAQWACPEQPVAIAHYHCELASGDRRARLRQGPRAPAHAREEQRDFGRSAILRGTWRGCRASRSGAQLYRRVVRRDFHLLALVLPRLAEASRQAGTPGRSTKPLNDLLQNGLASRSEIAYAAIVSGYYDDPAVLDCVREWISADNDSTTSPVHCCERVEPTREQLLAVANAMRNVVLRHARYRCKRVRLDSSSFLCNAGLQVVGHAARHRGARVHAARGPTAFAVLGRRVCPPGGDRPLHSPTAKLRERAALRRPRRRAVR